ncbi:MAG: RIP metalloprotease RseP [Candidatus Marinimicrobia bacterium]|jgi:regulator of sigma E protease|nr:RIP metalloprotease RseP [Candidatus Neomarinimicrobiota bacterium]
MTTLWAFIILLGVLITIHEFGHFMAARSVGVRVERFSIGIPPRFLTIESIDDGLLCKLFFFKRTRGSFKWQPVLEKHINRTGRLGSGTEYVVALLPLGGYVKMAGIIDENMDTEINYEEDEFMSKPLWAKLWILSAGVIMNTILAFILFASLGYYQGSAEIKDEPVVRETIGNMPAEMAGIIPGDRIIKINDNNVKTWSELTSLIKTRPNTKIDLVLERDDSMINLEITTTTSVIPVKGGMDTVGVLGIYPEMVYMSITAKEAISIGFSRTIGSFMMIIESLRMLGAGDASVSDFGGPILIAQLAGQTAEAGLIPFLTFMALLSVNLAFLNILPIPGLDGGHILIHLIEAAIRRPLTLKTRIAIQQIGMAFILILMVTIIFQDITRLFN